MDEREAAMNDLLEGEHGTVRAAARHHYEQMENEDGDHYWNQDWRQCPGCQMDNPHYAQVMDS